MTAVFGKPLGFIRRFRQCERAGISIMIAAAGTVLALSSLFAFDVARAHMAFSRLQTATDAAALAATRDIKSPTLNKDIQQIFDANFPPGYLGSSTADIRMEIVSNAGSVQRLQVAVTIELPSPITAMLRRAGGDFQTISAAAQTERRAFGSELALVINNGDLMHEGNRMRSAREAAQALLNHLYNGQETVPGLYVSVVPFPPGSILDCNIRTGPWTRPLCQTVRMPGVIIRRPIGGGVYWPAQRHSTKPTTRRRNRALGRCSGRRR